MDTKKETQPQENWEKERFMVINDEGICDSGMLTDMHIYKMRNVIQKARQEEREKWEKKKIVIKKGQTHTIHDKCEDCFYQSREEVLEEIRKEIEKKSIPIAMLMAFDIKGSPADKVIKLSDLLKKLQSLKTNQDEGK